jgi:ATP-dependent exoDNAse (exonuclease V) beta subunit
MMPNVMELWIILRAWLDEHITCVYQQETDVFSRRLCVAGRFDLLAAIDGLLSVVDFKTSKRFKKDEYLLDYKLQGTFYACAVYELTGHKVSQIALPVMYPGGLQVVTFKPFTYFDELRRRIDQFYATAVA